jgi:integrase
MRREDEDDETTKIYGPYEHHGGNWRVHVVRGRGGSRKTVYQTFESRKLAEKWIAGARDEAQGVTVSDAIEQYVATKVAKGREDSTIGATRSALHVILAPYLQRPIRSIDGRGEELYAQAQVYPPEHDRAGQARAADTHRVWLTRAKGFGKWCVKQGWFKASPFVDVEPVGRRTYGADKPRLGVDQSRTLRAYCLAHPEDHGAVLTLAYLELGPRASELVGRSVGDLDDGGRLLVVGKTKTLAGRRRLRIPDELVPLLLGLAAGKPPEAPLFASEPTRRCPELRRWSRFAAYHHVRRVCRAAGVPPLGPQAQRRTQSTLATDAGATGIMVAQHLGHAVADAPVVTQQHYIGRSEAKDAQIDRAMRMLAGEQP